MKYWSLQVILEPAFIGDITILLTTDARSSNVIDRGLGQVTLAHLLAIAPCSGTIADWSLQIIAILFY